MNSNVYSISIINHDEPKTFADLLERFCVAKRLKVSTAYEYESRLRMTGWADFRLCEVTNEVWQQKQFAMELSANKEERKAIYCERSIKILWQLIEFGRIRELVNVSLQQEKTKFREVTETPVVPMRLVNRVPKKLFTEGITFGELFKTYIDYHARAHCKRWKDNERAHQYLRDWDEVIARNIGVFDVQQLHASIGNKNGKTTANRVVQLLRAVYNKALAWEIYEGPNPGIGVQLFRLKSRGRFLEIEEISRFVQAIQTLRYRTTRDFLLMCLLTGARRSNVAAMRWDEISLDQCVWTIPDTKNDTSQRVPLTEWALNLLQSRLELLSNSEWVFPSDRSAKGHLTKPENAFKKIKLRAGLDDIRIHDLRRSLASWEAMTGANLSVIMNTLNHKDFKSVQVYARLNVESVRHGMTVATNKMFSGLTSETDVSPLPF